MNGLPINVVTNMLVLVHKGEGSTPHLKRILTMFELLSTARTLRVLWPGLLKGIFASLQTLCNLQDTSRDTDDSKLATIFQYTRNPTNKLQIKNHSKDMNALIDA